MKKKSKVRGAHYTIDFFGCDSDQLNSLSFWQKTLPQAAEVGNLEVLYSYFHEFEPHGITGFLLLSSSHISFHTWPEYNYAACDVFSCTNGYDTQKSVAFLKKQLKHDRLVSNYIKRGYVVMDYFISPIYATGRKEYIKVLKKVVDIKSSFQDIVVIDTAKYGRCMYIDNLIQTSTKDHQIYDKALLKKLVKKDQNLLILGGGDGYVAESALKLNPKVHITIVDLDQEVINVAKKHLGQKVFSHKNVKLVIGDAVAYMKSLIDNGDAQFDGIISDLTDNPVGGRENRKEMTNFYKKVFSMSHKLLRENGWFSAQAGAAKVVKRYFNSVKLCSELMQKEFGDVERKDVMIPSFSERNSFLYARKDELREEGI